MVYPTKYKEQLFIRITRQDLLGQMLFLLRVYNGCLLFEIFRIHLNHYLTLKKERKLISTAGHDQQTSLRARSLSSSVILVPYLFRSFFNIPDSH